MNTKKLDDINFIVLMLIDIRATYSFILVAQAFVKSLIDTCTLAIEKNSKFIVILSSKYLSSLSVYAFYIYIVCLFFVYFYVILSSVIK